MSALIRTIDYHTGGEPFRIVEAPFALPGESVADRRVWAIADTDAQRLREVLCFEPRGHADMYGGFLVPPDDEGADLGVLFWHKDGFSTACGHGTIALGAWAVETGRVTADPNGPTEVVIDVPSGRVRAVVHCVDGVVRDVDFVNVPSFAVALDVSLETSVGTVTVDIGFGGAMYVHVDATALGWRIDAAHLPRMIELGREVRDLVDATGLATHDDDRLSGVYGTIFVADGGGTPAKLEQTNVTIFADGEVDRSPCGSGTASRVAVLSARGRLADDGVLAHHSIVGSTFVARVDERVTLGEDRDAVVPRITGTAYLTGRHEFVLDPRDPLVPGFVLR